MPRVAPVLFAMVVAAMTTPGCGRAHETQQNVELALDQANIPTVTVKVDEDANVVRLRGSVDSMADRTRAQEIAAAAVGTTGRVLNELTVEGLNSGIADDLDHQILGALDRAIDSDAVLKERDINFEVAHGAVTVKGEVRSAAEKNKVTRIVRSAPGVKGVANALEIRSED